MSPIYNNNPGYAVLTLTSEYKIDDFKARFMVLPDYHRFGGMQVFSDYSLKSEYGDLNDAAGIRKMDTSLLYNYQKNVKIVLLGSG
jgi:hypothetical protein